MRRTWRDSGRDIPVLDEVDVLVCGGGPAGFCAAVAAARAGANTLLVEQMGCLGGIATAGGHNHICTFNAWSARRRVVGGIAHEMARRVVDMGFGAFSGDGANVDFELDGMKLALEQMAAEAGAKLLYYTQFAEPAMAAARVVGAVVQNKSGRQAVLARRVVDATGDADVAARAGAPFELGRPGDGACQPATLMFTVGGVDWDKVRAWRTDYQMRHVWAEAQRNGDMEPFQDQIMGFWWTPTRPDQVGVNFTHVVGADATSAASLTAATVEGRRQAFHMIGVFRKYVPGMEGCYMISTAALVGVRESRRIVGRHVLTDEEILARATWDDSICYGSFFIDVHNCNGPGMDADTYRPEAGFRYQIPYGCIVPRDVDNLLVAGRCVSVTHRALGSTRVMPQCGALGQAAGTAAALSIRLNCTPREVPHERLAPELRAAGCLLDEDDVARVNGEGK